jgi:hypothetical protein
MYTEGIQNIMAGNIDLDTNTFKAVLVDGADYTPDTAAAGDDSLADIAAGGRVATSASFGGLSVADGVFDANDISFTGSGGEDSCEYVIIYKDSGVEATSYLVCIFDTGTGLPFTPPAGAWTFNVTWDSGANKIFKIG